MSEQVLGRKIANMPLWVRAAAIGGLGVGVMFGLAGCGSSAEGSNSSGGVGVNQTSSPELPPVNPSSRCPIKEVGCHDAPSTSAPGDVGKSHGEDSIPNATSKSAEDVKFVFNSECLPQNLADPNKRTCLNVIQVYSNPQEDGRGSATGTFMNGDNTATAGCFVIGREVTRQANEYPGEDSTWYRINEAGREYYATGAYGAPANSVNHC
ncbi:MAG TPA: hypothetical protein VLG16_00635 [Candidatus Saccharimonadales bacterium]|nr:hypothetical protein [Candidatus Saccharimonadales bacterium]